MAVKIGVPYGGTSPGAQYPLQKSFTNPEYPYSRWIIQSADATIGTYLPWNPSYDADTDANPEMVINKGLNLGASINYIQVLSTNSPVREVGVKGNPLFVDRHTRNVIWAIYYNQMKAGYCQIVPRVPYTGFDTGTPKAGSPSLVSVRNGIPINVFLHPLRMDRLMQGGGDMFQLQATFTYLEKASFI